VAIWFLWLRGGAAEMKMGLKPTEEVGEPVQGDGRFAVKVRHRVASLIFFTAVVFTTFNFLAETYMSVLAGVSNWLVHVAGFENGDILPKGKALSIVFPTMKMGWYVTIASIFDCLLFITLVICFSRARTLVRPAVYLFSGLAFIMAIHIGAVTATYMDLIDGAADWRGLYVVESMIPILPFFIWLFLNASDLLSEKWSFRDIISRKRVSA
jgi:hypothetical protein